MEEASEGMGLAGVLSISVPLYFSFCRSVEHSSYAFSRIAPLRMSSVN